MVKTCKYCKATVLGSKCPKCSKPYVEEVVEEIVEEVVEEIVEEESTDIDYPEDEDMEELFDDYDELVETNKDD